MAVAVAALAASNAEGPIVVRRAPRVSDVVAKPVGATGLNPTTSDLGLERLSRIESEYMSFPKTTPLKKRARGQRKTRAAF